MDERPRSLLDQAVIAATRPVSPPDKPNLAEFVERGWLVLPLSNEARAIVEEGRELLLRVLRESVSPSLYSIEEYHRNVEDDARHIELQDLLSKEFQKARVANRIIRADLPIWQSLLGLDLHIQKFPYLRIARPGKAQDNIGIHRDTHYGATPYEVSVSLAFTDNGTSGALGVISGSHIGSEADFPITQTQSADVTKGSVKHRLGFLYAPKQMSAEVRSRVVPVPVRPGEALAFSLSLIHGQEINSSAVTRFATDIRLVNSFAPIQWERTVHADYYEPLAESPVAQQARRYYAANRETGHGVSK